MNVTLYGAARDSIDPAYIEAVEELGKEMARHGHTMVFGAGQGGLMGAAARGVHAAGGRIIGVSPHFMHTLEPISDLCTELIETRTMAERKTIMEEKGEAFIICPGGVGTLDEFFQIVTLKELKRNNKPIVLYNVRGYWDGLLSVIGTDIFKGFINKNVADLFAVCESPAAVMREIEKKEKSAEQ